LLTAVVTLRLFELSPTLEATLDDARLSGELRKEIGETVELLRTDRDPYSSLRGLDRR
jgi:hypothetical protein